MIIYVGDTTEQRDLYGSSLCSRVSGIYLPILPSAHCAPALLHNGRSIDRTFREAVFVVIDTNEEYY